MVIETLKDRQNKIRRVMELVEEVHADQQYGVVFDYKMHLYSCYYKAIEAGCENVDILAAILGHDITETRPGICVTYLSKNIGGYTAYLIGIVSRMEDEQYFQYIQRICSGPIEGIFIKFIDVLVNSTGLRTRALFDPHGEGDLVKRYDQALQYMEGTLKDRFGIERKSGWSYTVLLNHVNAYMEKQRKETREKNLA